VRAHGHEPASGCTLIIEMEWIVSACAKPVVSQSAVPLRMEGFEAGVRRQTSQPACAGNESPEDGG
jgi:hypothetical protein